MVSCTQLTLMIFMIIALMSSVTHACMFGFPLHMVAHVFQCSFHPFDLVLCLVTLAASVSGKDLEPKSTILQEASYHETTERSSKVGETALAMTKPGKGKSLIQRQRERKSGRWRQVW
jgi:hypothetical protein